MAIHRRNHQLSPYTNPPFLHRNGRSPSNILQLQLRGLVNHSTMFLNNVAANKKRKMNEVAAETAQQTTLAPAAANQINLFNLQPAGQAIGQTLGISSTIPPECNQSYVQQILNAASPLPKPYSFMSLLNAPDHEDDHLHNAPFPNLKFQADQIDHTITFYNENLKRSLIGLIGKQRRDIEEKAVKKLKEKEDKLHERNMELEEMVETYKKENLRLKAKVRSLERTTGSLRASLDEAISARRYAVAVEEDAESSFVDPNRVDLVRLDCKACESQVATMMLWPCRHVCVCKRCEPKTKKCLVCGQTVTTSVEICLPPN